MAGWLDGVLFTPTLGGTTDWVVSAAVIGYNTPALAGAAAIKYKYHAQSADLSQWEDGEGLYVPGTTTLPRTTVLYNSSGTGTAAGQSGAGTKISFTTVPTVSVIALKEDMISVEEANSFTAVQQAQARTNIGIAQAVGVAVGGNLNSIVNAGSYYTMDNTATNTPYASTLAYWYLTVEIYAIPTTFVKQTATRLDVAGNDTFIRVQISGTWGAWAPVITGVAPSVALTLAQQAQARANIAATASIYFSAYLSSTQTAVLATPTKIQFNTKIADSNGFYDNVTNFRFQPTIAGKYKVQVHLQGQSATVQYTIANIYKNGSNYGQAQLAGNTTSQNADIDMIIVFNGSTDYVEAWGTIIGTGTPSYPGGTAPIQCWFEAWYMGP